MVDGMRKAANKIKQAKTIAIACHINPDGDCIGSLLSLGLGLKKLGKTVYMLSSDPIPKKYLVLPGADKILKTVPRAKIDLGITVDCSTKELLGTSYKELQKADYIAEMDHHAVRGTFGDLEVIDLKASAVGEIIYRLLVMLKVEITKDIAENILTSIVVETNSFRLPNVRAYTFFVCEQMLKTGVNFYHLTEAVYWTSTKSTAVLSGLCLARCKFAKKGKLVWSNIKGHDFDRVSGTEDDVDAVADEMRAIKDVTVAVLFREKRNGDLRVSLRSKGNINVAILAERWGGGGHADVAGCVIPNKKGNVDKMLEQAKALIK